MTQDGVSISSSRIAKNYHLGRLFAIIAEGQQLSPLAHQTNNG